MSTNTNINLLPGDYITVVKWLYINDRSYIGQIFQILAIESNLIQVERQDSLKDLLLFNSEELELRRVSKDFAEKVINKDRTIRGN